MQAPNLLPLVCGLLGPWHWRVPLVRGALPTGVSAMLGLMVLCMSIRLDVNWVAWFMHAPGMVGRLSRGLFSMRFFLAVFRNSAAWSTADNCDQFRLTRVCARRQATGRF